MRLLLLVFILSAGSAAADQLYFRKDTSGDSISLSYRWLDQLQREQSLEFAFSKQMYDEQYHNTTQYQADIAQRYVYVAMMKQVRKIDPKQARIDIRQLGDQISVSVRSRNPENIEKYQHLMAQEQDHAFGQYLYDHYYALHENHLGMQGVIPDHLRYIAESDAILLPVAQAIYDKLETNSDTRAYINLLLSWIQTIPYDTLQNRLSSNGAGFANPVELLVNNLGDCDSKATLMATLMRALLPNMSIAIVYLPNHALLAINLGFQTSDNTVDVNGIPHILLDPTGPAQLTMGNISDDTAAEIASGRYSTKVVP